MGIAFSTLTELLCHRAHHQPDQVAYRFLLDGETESSCLTYGELDAQARVIAAYLQAHCVPGDRALLIYPSSLDFIVAFFGCLYAGLIAVPAYPPRANHNANRLKAIVADASPSIVLTTRKICDQLQMSSSNELMSTDRYLVTDQEVIDQDLHGQATNWQDSKVTAQTLAFLQYTSGSTGTPKGVMLTHDNLMYNEYMIQVAFGHTDQTVFVGWLPLHHDMGLIGNVLQPLYLGIPCVLMPPAAFFQKPIRWLQAISDYRATTSGGPNFAYDLCMNRISAEQKTGLDLSSWAVAFNGAEPIRAETVQRFADVFAECGFSRKAFYPCYGMAETSLLVSGGDPRDFPVLQSVESMALEQHRVVPVGQTSGRGDRPLVGCGRTILDQAIIIVDPNTQTQCQLDQVGEIWVSGKNVAQGYWNRESETRETFWATLSESIDPDTTQQHYLRTGDLGFLNADGELFVTGRLKDVIIIRGRNFYPQDIEQAAEKGHPGLQPSGGAAFSVEINNRECLIIAHEVKRSYLRHLNVAEMSSAIRGVISAEFDLEVHSVVLLKTSSILKTSSGKIQRRACRNAFLAGTLNVVGCDEISRNSDFVAPETAQQQRIAQLFAEVLSIPTERIGIHDSFFDLGGHSLLATQLMTRLRETFDVELPLRTLFQFSTISEMANVLTEENISTSVIPPILPRSDQPSLVPLSFAQERLWFLCQFEGISETYNISGAIQIDGLLDLDVLQQAIEKLVQRHEALRTTFLVIDGVTRQQVHPSVCVPLQVIEGKELDVPLDIWLKQESQNSFNLTSDPPLRLRLVRLSEKQAFLSITIHHIISDGWSLGIFIRELAALYQTCCNGQVSSLNPLPIQYADYAIWQRQWLQGEVLQIQLEYWKNQLSGILNRPLLPTDYPRPAAQTFQAQTQKMQLSLDLTQQTKALAQQQGMTLFMVLLTIFQILLYRYSGQSDIVIGTPVANRQRSELELLIGFFVNTLVLRTQIKKADKIADVLHKARQMTLDVYTHQDVPFDQVVQALQPERNGAHLSLFQVWFVLQNSPLKAVELSDVAFTPLIVETDAARHDLSLSMEETEQGLVGIWVYNSSLFKPETIKHFSDFFVEILEKTITQPDQLVENISLLSQTQLDQDTEVSRQKLKRISRRKIKS